MVKQRWWFSVSWVDYPIPHRRVERFETMEQALLHAAATDGLVPFVHNLLDADSNAAKRAYDYYFAFSEPIE